MKSNYVSGRAASDSEEESCWHLLNFPKAKKSKTRDSMDSGVLQPTGFQVRIIFADAGCIPSRLEKCLIKDERVHLLTLDLLETAGIFDAANKQ